ncbi:hypothetical protein TNIN_282821 [Trichonephila inaurata madagascariensis]|uniref:Uncharacterized protein n=1 Tax=Trichonephila inaurata madagascariensis TaxID=2747483 RepID=A0A8X6YUH3_9ARAC|nr:hypothetical protein TNIN_282821 [Trichonephila inaurata madagascariensis]
MNGGIDAVRNRIMPCYSIFDFYYLNVITSSHVLPNHKNNTLNDSLWYFLRMKAPARALRFTPSPPLECPYALLNASLRTSTAVQANMLKVTLLRCGLIL